MKLSASNLKFLGLSDDERKIIDALSDAKSAKVTDLARTTKIPRTTVFFLLNKMKRRGLAERVTVKRHKEWKTVSSADIANRLREALRAFEKQSGMAGMATGDDAGIELFQGRQNIREAYHKIFQASKNDRVYAIQGNMSARLSLQKIEKEYFFDFHRQFKKRDVILEGIIGKSALRLFHEELGLEELRSHLGRLVVAYVVPDEYVNFDMDVLFFGRFVLLINFEKESVMVIKNEFMVRMLRGLLMALQASGTKIDLNSYIKRLIEERQKA